MGSASVGVSILKSAGYFGGRKESAVAWLVTTSDQMRPYMVLLQIYEWRFSAIPPSDGFWRLSGMPLPPHLCMMHVIKIKSPVSTIVILARV